ncbi:MAG: MMPL family transporter, partial [Gemmatimonadota bacterium]|nr:MMPL family transporter [Gemmatimonadota bacterium]
MTIRTPVSACCRWIARHPWGTLWHVAACVLPLTLAAGGLRPDNRLAVWFVEDDPALVSFERFLADFGNDEAVAVVFRAPDPVLAPAEQARLRHVVARLRAIDGVAEVLAPLGGPGGAPAEALRRAGLLGEDGRTATLRVRMQARDDLDAMRGRVLAQVREALAATLGSERAPRLAGTGVLYDALNRQTMRDSGLFFGLAFLAMTGLLRLALRRWRATLIVLAAPAAAVGATLGAFALAGRPMTQVTAVLPLLV